MENQNQIKIVPKTRKKLLQQALLKDSPTNSSLNQRKFFHHQSKTLIPEIENLCPQSQKLDFKHSSDINFKSSQSTLQTENTYWDLQGLQEILVKLWKISRRKAEIDDLLRSEIHSFASIIPEKSVKLKDFFYNLIKLKQSSLPESLTPYLEQIISKTKLTFPLIQETCSAFEAEILLLIPIIRLSKTKIELLRKTAFPSESLKKSLKVLLLCLNPVLQTQLPTGTSSKIWESFLQISSSPGQFTQNLRKIPESLKKSFFSSSTLQIPKTLNKVKEIPESSELFSLLSEIGQYLKVLEGSVQIKASRIKKLENFYESSSLTSRPLTPATGRVTALTRRLHTRSASREIVLNKKSLSMSQKRLQFLHESRFNKKIEERVLEIVVKKMADDPGYLVKMRKEDYGKYLKYKEEVIDIHKATWVEEAVGMLLDEDRGNEFKEEVFSRILSSEEVVQGIVKKAKKIIFKV